MMPVAVFFALIPFYLLGAFPTGVLVSKLYGIDITGQGSGNVGATNVARVVGKRAGIFTLLGDVAKGALGASISYVVFGDSWPAAAAAAAVVLGHCFSLPPYLKGGKGVATAIGVIATVSPVLALIAVAVFVVTFLASKIVSLSSLLAAVVVPVAAILMNFGDAATIALGVISAVVVFRHRENIQRLIEGREEKFQAKSQS